MACLRGSRCTKLPEACFLVGTVLGAFVLEGTPFACFSTGTFTSFLGEGHEKKRGAILHPVVQSLTMLRALACANPQGVRCFLASFPGG